MTKEQFRTWVEGIAYSSRLMHSKIILQSGLGVTPETIAPFDARAAELLGKARQAHDELIAYLASRANEPRVKP